MTFVEQVAELRAEGRVAEINGLVPYADFLGVESYVEDGQIITALRFHEELIGNYTARIFHGGAVGALLEQAAFVHLLDQGRQEKLPKVINISANYLRPVAPADVLASGVIVRQGARIANVRVRAWQKTWDDPVATADVHFLLSKRSEPAAP